MNVTEIGEKKKAEYTVITVAAVKEIVRNTKGMTERLPKRG